MAYKTLKALANDEIIIKKSRFICYARPVETEADALNFLSELRMRHKDASHCCYAYVIGANMGITRYSDDGEPSGTAGMPIFEVVKAQQVTNCVVAVVRYFGGVLLGANGLIRAYARGAAAAIKKAGIVTMRDSVLYSVKIAYPDWNKIQHELKQTNFITDDVEYGENITAAMICLLEDKQNLENFFANASDGRAVPELIGEMLMAWVETGE